MSAMVTDGSDDATAPGDVTTPDDATAPGGSGAASGLDVPGEAGTASGLDAPGEAGSAGAGTAGAGRPAAIVTGASRGIGRGVALAVARAGYDVVVNYARNGEAADAVVAEIEKIGTRAVPIRADISVAADRERLVNAAIDAYGRIDLLVNNAGMAPTVRADILAAGEESFDTLVAVNLKGPYFLTQLVARAMIDGVRRQVTPAPKIVIISSISAYTASVNRGDYCVTKAGLSMVTKLFATRLAEYGINVYEIRPGIVATDMTGAVKEKYDRMILEEGITPIRRWGEPDDIGRAVAAIASGALGFSTGQVIDVDGGFHLRTL